MDDGMNGTMKQKMMDGWWIEPSVDKRWLMAKWNIDGTLKQKIMEFWRMNGWMDGMMKQKMNGWMVDGLCIDETRWMEWNKRWLDGTMKQNIMDEWNDETKYEWMDGWWNDETKDGRSIKIVLHWTLKCTFFTLFTNSQRCEISVLSDWFYSHLHLKDCKHLNKTFTRSHGTSLSTSKPDTF